jgi:DNA-binding NarL/FixJ family response regulator
MDLSMPQMNGLEASTILHSVIPKTPIILFTLHREAVSNRQASDAGITSIVSKSDRIGVLGAEILRLLARKYSHPKRGSTMSGN